MRRSGWQGIAIVVGLVIGLVNWLGCSSIDKQNIFYGGPPSRLGLLDIPAEDRVRPLLPGERSPAGDPKNAVAQQVQPVAVNWLGGTFSFSMVLSRVNDWSEAQYYQDKRFVRTIEHQRGECGGWSCPRLVKDQETDHERTQKTNQKKNQINQRAEFLQKAVVGLSVEVASKLIERKIMIQKPSSWEDLVAAIRKAEHDKILPSEMAYAIVVTHRYINLSNLGYAPGVCRSVVEPCEAWRERFNWETYTASRPAVLRSIIDQVTRPVELIVREPHLQSFEVEHILVVADEETTAIRTPSATTPPRIRVVVDGPTVYEQKIEHLEDRTRITLVGKERVQVPLPESALGPVVYRSGSINPVFKISVDPNYIPQPGYDDQLVLRYAIRTCPSINKICFGGWRESEIRYVPIAAAETSIDITVDRGQSTNIVYSVARKNSKLYSGAFLRERETDSFYVR